jgi:hypothetical protein
MNKIQLINKIELLKLHKVIQKNIKTQIKNNDEIKNYRQWKEDYLKNNIDLLA